MPTPYDYPELAAGRTAQTTQVYSYVVAAGATDPVFKVVPPANATLLVIAKVSAIGLTTKNGASYVRAACFKRQSGAPSQIGTTAALATFEDVAGWDCTIALVGGSVAVTATGDPAEQTRWSAVIKTIVCPFATDQIPVDATHVQFEGSW